MQSDLSHWRERHQAKGQVAQKWNKAEGRSNRLGKGGNREVWVDQAPEEVGVLADTSARCYTPSWA